MKQFMINLITNKWYATKQDAQAKVGQLIALNLLLQADAEVLLTLIGEKYPVE